MISSCISIQFNAFVEQLKPLVIACAGKYNINNVAKYYVHIIVVTYYFSKGNDLTENDNPDKDFAMLINTNTKCAEYLNENRFNIDFKDALIKKKGLLQPHITILPIDQSVKDKLLELFYMGNLITTRNDFPLCH